MPETHNLFCILPLYDKLEAERRSRKGRLFISDFNGIHPYLDDYLGDLAKFTPTKLGEISRYAAIDEDLELRYKIGQLHDRLDGVTYDAEHIVPSGGSSSLIGSICTWLMLSGCTKIYYFPPVYYKFAFWFKKYGIEPIQVSESHAFQSDFSMRLPREKTVLIITDPIWYAGHRVPDNVLNEIAEWQESTGSFVIIDGTFQYMRWDGKFGEHSARLVPEQTIRLVCPTKYLSLHGYRSAYLIMPKHQRDEFAELHLNLHGDVSLSDRLFAHQVCEVMVGSGNRALTLLAQKNYQRLVDGCAIQEHVNIESGYFLFTKINMPCEQFLCLDQHFFELNGYHEYVRVNLLNVAAVEALLNG